MGCVPGNPTIQGLNVRHGAIKGVLESPGAMLDARAGPPV